MIIVTPIRPIPPGPAACVQPVMPGTGMSTRHGVLPNLPENTGIRVGTNIDMVALFY